MEPFAVLFVLLTIVLTVLIIIHFTYRRYIKKLCRRLLFIQKNLTNMQLHSDLPYKELEELTGLINEVLLQTKEMRIEMKRNADGLRKTISNLSHDIRTPLTSLDGYFQLLIDANSDEERNRIQGIIHLRINSLRDMLEEMFSYTKLQDEDYKLNFETVDIAGCVAESVISFYDDFNARGLIPTIEYDEQPFFGLSNEKAIHRLIQNIIKNALDHGLNEIRISIKKEDRGLVFRCSNDVENPDAIDLQEVFTRFYKADSARSKTSTGLGLSIAKTLAELLHADIVAALNDNTFVMEVVFSE
ncbi:MAG: HAMP domain-containing sensor histidine kinase [Bacillota bacterium]|nr:HAMP domain-containing sensor histidine kinase [Bacillota bacterium]